MRGCANGCPSLPPTRQSCRARSITAGPSSPRRSCWLSPQRCCAAASAAIACGVLALASTLAALWPARKAASDRLPAEIAAAFPQANTPAEAQAAILDALALPQRRAQAEAQARQADAALQQLLQLLPAQPHDDAMQELDARRTSCRQQLAAAQARLEAYPPLLQLQQQRKALTDRLAALTQHYEALGLALDALQQASDTLQARFAPPLRRLAGEYLAQLTGIPHRQLELDRQLQVRLQEPGDPVAHSSRCYSSAACDQIWLALRLAIAPAFGPAGDALRPRRRPGLL